MSEMCAEHNCKKIECLDWNHAPKGLFYIQDLRSYCGNSVMWWRVGGHGYTSNLDEAWKVPATWRGRDTDKLWLCSEIDSHATRQFDMQLFSEVGK